MVRSHYSNFSVIER